MKIGCCVNLDEAGLLGAAKEAYAFGANTFMIYANIFSSKFSTEVEANGTNAVHKYMESHDMGDIIVHTPFCINLATRDEKIANISLETLKNSLKFTDSIRGKSLILHPGYHLGDGERTGIKRIIKRLNTVLDDYSNINIALETMSGQGTEIGSLFEEIASIIDGVIHNERLKICFDTCHVFSSGYDIASDIDSILNKFEKDLGLEKIEVIHLNDSKFHVGARKDRHENIGYGCIGFDALYDITTLEMFDQVPFILETPYRIHDGKVQPIYAEEIKMLKTGEFNGAEL